MKKLLILFALIISGIAFGQFTVSDSSENWEKIGNAYAHTILYQKKDKSKAKIEYRDFQNQFTLAGGNIDLTYYNFEFSTEPDTLDKMYLIFKDHFASKKVETLTLQFPEGKIIIEFGKALGTYYALMQFEKANILLDQGERAIKSTGSMKEKQIDKLFGK